MDDDTKRRFPLLVETVAGLSWRFVITVIAAGIVVYGLVQLRLVVLPIIIAAFLTTLLAPLADRLRERGAPPALAAFATLIGGLLVLVAALGFIVAQVVNESDTLADRATEAVDEIEDWLVTGPIGADRSNLQDLRDRLGEAVSDNSDTITQGAITAGGVLIQVVTGAVLTVILIFFMLKDGHRAGDLVGDTVRPEWADDLRALGGKVWLTMSGYLRGVALTGVVDGVMIGIGLVVLGVPLAAPLALLTFLGAFIPLVGATVAGVLAAAVALVSNGPFTALLVGALVLVVQQVEGNVLAPLVLSRAVQLHAVTILLSLTAGSIIAGIVGAFLAVPIAAVAKTIIVHYRVGPASDGSIGVDTEPEDEIGQGEPGDVAVAE